MSYEKAIITGIRQIVKKETGEVHNFVEVEVLQTHQIYMTAEALKQLPVYEKIKGKQVLIPVSWGEYKGKPSLSFVDDCVPLPLPQRQ